MGTKVTVGPLKLDEALIEQVRLVHHELTSENGNDAAYSLLVRGMAGLWGESDAHQTWREALARLGAMVVFRELLAINLGEDPATAVVVRLPDPNAP